MGCVACQKMRLAKMIESNADGGQNDLEAIWRPAKEKGFRRNRLNPWYFLVELMGFELTASSVRGKLNDDTC